MHEPKIQISEQDRLYFVSFATVNRIEPGSCRLCEWTVELEMEQRIRLYWR